MGAGQGSIYVGMVWLVGVGDLGSQGVMDPPSVIPERRGNTIAS